MFAFTFLYPLDVWIHTFLAIFLYFDIQFMFNAQGIRVFVGRPGWWKSTLYCTCALTHLHVNYGKEIHSLPFPFISRVLHSFCFKNRQSLAVCGIVYQCVNGRCSWRDLHLVPHHALLSCIMHWGILRRINQSSQKNNHKASFT